MTKPKTTRASKWTPSPPAPPFDPATAPERMTRPVMAAFLTAIGYPIAVKTLAQRAAGRGEGPPYRMFNGRCLYDKADAIAWAEAQLSPKARNTSEHEDLARQQAA